MGKILEGEKGDKVGGGRGGERSLVKTSPDRRRDISSWF